MKRTMLYFLMALAMVGTQLTACKSKKTNTNTTLVTDTAVTHTDPAAPVVISPDDSLTTGVRDATKDYPGVTANVNNGEVTLTGTVKRDRLKGLMQSIQSLHPKKVNNNNLTIQP